MQPMYRILLYLTGAGLLLSSCAPEPVFRLASRDDKTTYYQGVEYVQFENDGLILSMGYYRHLGEQFIMDVEIINERDSTLLIDPLQFSSIAYGGYYRTIPNDSMPMITEYHAADPEEELIEVDKQISSNEAARKTDQTFFLIGQGLSVASQAVSDDPEERKEIRQERTLSYLDQERDDRQYRINRANLRDLRQAWEQEALRKTHLMPGEYLRGLVFFKTIKDAIAYSIRFEGAGTNFSTDYFQYKYKP